MSGDRILYVTRKFPPRVGGMEAYAATMAAALGSLGDAEVMAVPGARSQLAWWLPSVGARLLARRRDLPGLIVCGDPVVFLALRPALPLSRVRVAVVVHGLDLTWAAPGYQAALNRLLPQTHRVIAISRFAAALAADHGVAPDRIAIVQPTVDAPPPGAGSPEHRASARLLLAGAAGIDPDRPIIATLGRLVARKGAAWFAGQVLPDVPEAWYVVAGAGQGAAAGAGQGAAAEPGATARAKPGGGAGAGPEAAGLPRAAAGAGPGTADRLRLLGHVGPDLREAVLEGADLFVMPNIKVQGNVEGFGIVALEAAVRGTPVLASAMEGIVDALDDGASGWLLAPGDAPRWSRTITELLADPAGLRQAGADFAVRARERADPARFTKALGAALDLS